MRQAQSPRRGTLRALRARRGTVPLTVPTILIKGGFAKSGSWAIQHSPLCSAASAFTSPSAKSSLCGRSGWRRSVPPVGGLHRFAMSRGARGSGSQRPKPPVGIAKDKAAEGLSNQTPARGLRFAKGEAPRLSFEKLETFIPKLGFGPLPKRQ